MADPKRLFEVLHRFGVQYVLIDDVAMAMYGVPVVAKSITVWVKDSSENHEALANALREMDAKLMLTAHAVELTIDAAFLAAERRDLETGSGLRFATDCGIVDIIYTPKGAGALTFDQVKAEANQFTLKVPRR